jgi:rod shape-determining protein MreD
MTLRVWRRLFVVGFVAVLFQVCALQQLVFLGAHPDTFLLLAICAGLVAGPQAGAVVGFVVGLVADVFMPTPYGLSALCYVLVAFGVGIGTPLQGDRAPHLFQVATAFVGSIGGTLLYEVLMILLGQPHLPRGELTDVIVVVSVANAALAVPAVWALRWVFAVPSRPGGRQVTPAGGGI